MHSRWLEYVAAVEKNDEELEAAKDMKSYTDPKYKPEKQITEPNVFMIVCVYFFLKKWLKIDASTALEHSEIFFTNR